MINDIYMLFLDAFGSFRAYFILLGDIYYIILPILIIYTAICHYIDRKHGYSFKKFGG